MSERIFRELPPVDPELEKALERERAKIDEPVYISASQVVVDTTGFKFENLARASAPKGYFYDNGVIRCCKCGTKYNSAGHTPCMDSLDWVKSQSSAHLGHHYGPVHPNIMPYTPVEKERS